MDRSGQFRSALFGGYNKSDVEQCVQALEKEVVDVKAACEEEKASQAKRLEECEEYKKEQEKQISELQKELAQAKSELKKQIQIAEKAETALAEKDAKLIQKEEALLRETERATELEKKLQEQHEENEKTLLDFQTIGKVLEDVSKDAELIKEEAREEGRKIVAAAIVEAETRKNVIAKRVDTELEEKAIQLVAAKHKIVQYVKEVNRAQEGLYNIYSGLVRMAENMPIRLEQFWDGEEYQAIEERMKERREKTL